MKKLLIAAMAATVGFGLMAENNASAPKNGEAKEAEVKEKSDEPALEIEFAVDLFSSYVWRNTQQSDRPVVQPCIAVDWTFLDPAYIGFFVWQNYDLTNRRRHGGYRGEWNETDYNVHFGTTLWSNDNEDWNLNLEAGHEWFTYNLHGTWGEDEGGYRKRKDFPTTYELYLKLELENPILTPYAQISHEYNRINGTHYELGLKKEITLADLCSSESELLSKFNLLGDVNVNFGSRKYLTYLYDGDPDTGDTINHGIGGITAKVGLEFKPCEHFTIGGIVAYTSILNGTARDEFDDMASYCDATDFVWCGVSAKVSF